MFKHATVGILIVGDGGEIIKANSFVETLFGYDPKELEGQSVDVLVPDAIKKAHAKHRQNYHKKPVDRVMGVGLDLYAKRKNGQTFPVEISLGHATVADKKIVIAYVNDITERKAYEATIEKEKNTAQVYLDIAGSMMVVINKEEEVTLLNQRGQEILGYQEQEVLGENWFNTFIPKAERKHVREVFERLMDAKGQNVEYYENSVLTKAGEKRLIWWHNRVLFNEIGEPLGTISSGVDITEQRMAEQELQASRQEVQEYAERLEQKVKKRTAALAESEQKLKEAQSIAKIGHWDVVVADNRLFFSKGMYQIFGLPENSFVSIDTVKKFVHPDDYEWVKMRIQQAFDKKESLSLTHRIITPRGTLKYVRSNMQVPVVDETGKTVRGFGVLKDITSQKQSELQLKESLNKEKELGLLKSRFVSMASHEFRTPLSSILSSAELLDMYIESGRLEKCDKNIKRIKNSVRNLTGILNDFLSLEKLEAGKVEVETTVVDLAEFLEELQEEIKPILRPGQALTFGDELPKTIKTDPYLLKNILINLTSNAIKYSPKGENVTIEISPDELGTQYIFKVIDQGIGIPEMDQQYMFTRFFRASNVENIKGTGLGLTIVKRYLDLLGGKIGFTSVYGKGSTFYFNLPSG